MNMSRRTIVVGALPAVAATAAVATAAPCVAFGLEAGHADAELLALGQEWRRVNAASRRAWHRMSDIEEALELPDVPDAVLWRVADHWLGLPMGQPWRGGQRWHGGNIDELRSVAWRTDKAQTRADEIVRAWEAWQAATKDIEDASGLTAAQAEDGRLNLEEQDLRKRIAAMPATTLAGLLVKAEVVLDAFPHDEMAKEIASGMRGGTPIECIMIVIVRDILNIGRGQ